MDVIELNVENKSDYDSILDQDVAESIGREYYRGLIAVDESSSPKGALIWEYKNLEEDEATNAEILFISSEDGEVLKALLSEFDELSSGEEVARSFFETGELSEDAKKSFTDKGFSVSAGESRDLILRVSDLAGLAGKKKTIPGNIVGLNDLTEVQFMQGVTNCLFNGKKGRVEDLEYIEKDWFDGVTSCCTLTDGKVSGMFLIHRFPSGALMPVLLTAMGPEPRTDMLYMIIFSAKKTTESFPEDTRVIIRRHSEAVRALSGKLFEGKTGAQALRGERS